MFSFNKAFLAGILISLGAMFSINVSEYGTLVQGLCFSLGLFAILLCSAQLFTGSILQIFSYWDRDRSFVDLAAFWNDIWIVNLLGSICMALVANVIKVDVTSIVQKKIALPVDQLIIKSILCNILVCLSVYIYSIYNDGHNSIPAAFISVLLPVACFISCGFEHSVANMFYMYLGILQGSTSVLDAIRVVLLSTIGNIIGGLIFSRLNYIKPIKK